MALATTCIDMEWVEGWVGDQMEREKGRRTLVGQVMNVGATAASGVRKKRDNWSTGRLSTCRTLLEGWVGGWVTGWRELTYIVRTRLHMSTPGR